MTDLAQETLDRLRKVGADLTRWRSESRGASKRMAERLGEIELQLDRLERWAAEEQHCQPLRPEDYSCGDPRPTDAEAPNSATHCPHDWTDQ